MAPQPTEEEIQFILDAIAEYLTVAVRRADVTSAWSGIRPLAIDPKAKVGCRLAGSSPSPQSKQSCMAAEVVSYFYLTSITFPLQSVV